MKKDFTVNADWHWTINAWMIQDLHLSGLPLNIFAILYGCQKGNSYKTYEKSFLAKLTGASSEGVRKALKKLCSLSLIETRKAFSCFGERTEIKVTYKPKKTKAKAKFNPTSTIQQSWQSPTNKVGTHLKDKELNINTEQHFRGEIILTDHENKILERLKESSVNKNYLYKAKPQFKALLDRGYSPEEIEFCWNKHQQELHNQKRKECFFTALWKWLDPKNEKKDAAIAMIKKFRIDQQIVKHKEKIRSEFKDSERKKAFEDTLLNKNEEYRRLRKKLINLAPRVIRDRNLEKDFYLLNEQLKSLREVILQQPHNHTVAL